MNNFWKFWLLVFGLLFTSCVTAAGKHAALEQGFINPGFHEKPDWFKNSFLDLREDVAEAAEEGKRIILYFHQDGCPYCAKLLNENFTLKQLVDKTRSHFEIVAINIWGDREVSGLQGELTSEKALAAGLKVMYTPTLLFLDEQGRTALRVNGYYPPHKFEAALDYVAGRLERKQSFRDYLAGVEPAPAAGVLHQAPEYLPWPLDLKRSVDKADRLLLVLMEQKQCPACDELHNDILQRPAVKESLDQFDVALVDVWSGAMLATPMGERIRATEWAAGLKIHYAPSLLFFDRSGKEVFRTDALLKTFHVHAAIDYVLTGAYQTQPNFQRFVQARADAMRAQGIEPDLMD
ncbi:MAG: thioredoxin fold domain-containing protein [Pseudomonadota bacterium]